jgi:hypothetical protein
MNVFKSPRAKILFVILGVLCFTVPGFSQEKEEGTMVIKFEKDNVNVEANSGKATTKFGGEVVYHVSQTTDETTFQLKSLSLVTLPVKTTQGDSGNISVLLKPGSTKSKYTRRTMTISSEFTVDVHYPLIDKIKGFKKIKEEEKEGDDFRSYTESFTGTLTCSFRDKPQVDRKKEVKKSAKIKLKMKLKKKDIPQDTMDNIRDIGGDFDAVEVKVYPIWWFFRKTLNVQPVFIRYTPATGVCCGGGPTATTGGSYTILRDRAIEMWDRCCIALNFLPPVYIQNNNYRILSAAEAAPLRATYDNANAVEVYIVEVSDPVGMWGGGASFSSGTANAYVITFDTNLPINLLNLAHELGHSLGLWHPPWNSTPGSLMEPSGFTLDNPPLMSDQNCNNASNPLVYYTIIPTACSRNTNM